MIEIAFPVAIDQGDVEVLVELSNRDYYALKRACTDAEENGELLISISDLSDEALISRITKKVINVLNTEPDYIEGFEDFEEGNQFEDMFDIVIGVPENFEE